jgi:hypothetical protein
MPEAKLKHCYLNSIKGQQNDRLCLKLGAAPSAPTAASTKTTSAPSKSPEDIIAMVVNQALDGDDAPLNALDDKVLRAKSKSLIMKINKGTAERPAMPEAGESSETSTKDEQTKESASVNQENVMEKLIADGINGNMDEINALEDKVMRGKIKAAIVKAKRSS